MEGPSVDPPQRQDSTIESTIERVVTALETSHTNLADTYEDWLQIGFGLAQELGEMGRGYFHRISKLSSKYTAADCDKKYDQCLKSNNSGTTIKTFFFLAKQAGIPIAPQLPGAQLAALVQKEPPGETELEEEFFIPTPTLPEKIYDNLPRILRESSSLFTPGIEKDIFALSALAVLSTCLPNLEGLYFNRQLSAHLYLFVTGPSASGKGTMIWARYFPQAIHENLSKMTALEQVQYLSELEGWESLPKSQRNGMPRPVEPPKKMFFIPANCSTSALVQVLAENNFRGLIFETEADTLSNAAKQDWGDSSDIFRKAFHHENTSMARRKDRELFDITNPHLGICISGTPKQVLTLMPEVENGLFSRFMYYSFRDTRGFLNPFVSYQPIDYHYFFTQKSYEVFHLHEKLSQLTQKIIFQFTTEQAIRFTNFFGQLLIKNKSLLSSDLDANIKRLGVITFRIAMTLSGLRLMELDLGKKIANPLVCSDQDFETAMSIASTLEAHAIAVYQNMPTQSLKGLRLLFFQLLPDEFTRKQAHEVAKKAGITEWAADKYIKIFKKKLLNHTYNKYTKNAQPP